jgi:hypothetical protein
MRNCLRDPSRFWLIGLIAAMEQVGCSTEQPDALVYSAALVRLQLPALLGHRV